MRARRSSTEIGCASAVKDFNSFPDAADNPSRAPSARTGATAAPPRNTRLDSMVILCLAPRFVAHATESSQGYCNSRQSRPRDVISSRIQFEGEDGNEQALRATGITIPGGANSD